MSAAFPLSESQPVSVDRRRQSFARERTRPITGTDISSGRRPSAAVVAFGDEVDASLATALVAGDPCATRRAWTRFSPLVLRILRRTFRPGSPDLPDLCQEVFLRLFSRIAELRDRRALRSFVIGICLGVAQNERRRARVRRSVNLAPTGELPDFPIAPSDLEARQALGRFCRILADLDAKDRALFVIRYVEKRELSEIASASGWPLTTTKRRVARVTRRVGLKMKRDPALADYVDQLLPSRA